MFEELRVLSLTGLCAGRRGGAGRPGQLGYLRQADRHQVARRRSGRPHNWSWRRRRRRPQVSGVMTANLAAARRHVREQLGLAADLPLTATRRCWRRGQGRVSLPETSAGIFPDFGLSGVLLEVVQGGGGLLVGVDRADRGGVAVDEVGEGPEAVQAAGALARPNQRVGRALEHQRPVGRPGPGLAVPGDVEPPLVGAGAGGLAGLGGAVHLPRHLDAGQVGHGRENIHLLPVAVVDHAVVLAGGLDDHRHHISRRLGLAEATGLLARDPASPWSARLTTTTCPHALGLELVDDLTDQPVGVGELEQVPLVGQLDDRGRRLVALEGPPEGLVVVLVARRQVAPRRVGQQQVQEVHGRPVGVLQAGQEVVEAGRLVEPQLVEAELPSALSSLAAFSVRWSVKSPGRRRRRGERST